MRLSLTQDLARWEQGVLSATELELRHPGQVVGLVALYERLSNLGGCPVPDAEVEWNRLREQLPDHRLDDAVRADGAPLGLRRLVARPLALAAVLVVVFGAAIGYAVIPEAVNRGLASVWESVEGFFGDEPSEEGPIGFPGGEQPGVVPSDFNDDDVDEGGPSTDDRDYREGRDNGRKASDEASGGGFDDSDPGSDGYGKDSDRNTGGTAGDSDGDSDGDGDGGGDGGGGRDGDGDDDSGRDDDDSGDDDGDDEEDDDGDDEEGDG